MMLGNILISILGVVIKAISPQLRKVLDKLVEDLERAAKQTPNEFDDLLVALLKGVLAL